MWKRHLTVLLTAATAALAGACAPPAPPPSTGEKLERIEEMIATYRELYPGVPGADAAAVTAALESGEALIVDVRTDEERAVSRIPGALSRDEFERLETAPSQAEVITYCTIGHRSAQFARELLEDGWSVRNFDGSLLAWTHSGGDLVDARGQPTRRLHVYGARWDLAAEEYETTW